MKQGFLRTGMACILTLAVQGCATSEDQTTTDTPPPKKDAETTVSCNTVFHCPAGPEDIRICRDDGQLQVLWQTPGIDAYRLRGSLGQTFNVRYNQTMEVIENTLSWQHLGIHYTAFHYLDESRPESLEEIGITLKTDGQSRTINCNDNAFSQMAQLHPSNRAEKSEAPAPAD